jgi:hypothetical protein
MPEIHTVHFVRGSLTVVSDAERGTISLRYPRGREGEAIPAILKVLGRRYGDAPLSRLGRWRAGERSPFVLPPRPEPHPEGPDILCFEIGIRRGERPDPALASLLDFLAQQPGYRRTLGDPLDRDRMPAPARKAPAGDMTRTAEDLLREQFRRRPGRSEGP